MEEKLSKGSILATVKAHKTISLSGMCAELKVNPHDEDTRPRYWRLVQNLACLLIENWIDCQWIRGERVYYYNAG